MAQQRKETRQSSSSEGDFRVERLNAEQGTAEQGTARQRTARHCIETHGKATRQSSSSEGDFRVERLYRTAGNRNVMQRREAHSREKKRGNHLLARVISELKDSTHCKAPQSKAPQSKATHGSAPQSIARQRNEIKRNAASLRLKQRLSESL